MTLMQQLAEHDHWFMIAKGWEAGLIMGIGLTLLLQRIERWWVARRAHRQVIARRMKRWNER